MLTALGVDRNQSPESSLGDRVWGRAEEAGARRLDCLWTWGPSGLTTKDGLCFSNYRKS